jgi:2-methylcitrate dehydratase PrpD
MSPDDPSMRMSAQTAAAAVTAVGSGSEAGIQRFAALVRRRNGSDTRRFVAVSVGAVASTLDERDVAALYRTLGLEAAPSPSLSRPRRPRRLTDQNLAVAVWRWVLPAYIRIPRPTSPQPSVR